jgi:hypothetical protein
MSVTGRFLKFSTLASAFVFIANEFDISLLLASSVTWLYGILFLILVRLLLTCMLSHCAINQFRFEIK